MIAFVLLAAGLTMAGVAAVAIPLLRRRSGSAGPASWAALGAASLLIIGSALLYVTWSNWPWRTSSAGDSPQTMVAHLARQLERDPNNLQGWLMLGRSYTVLQEYPLALRAYERAERLSGGKSADALTGEAEALALSDEAELDGRAGRLIERALVLAPDSARQRFVKLLAMNPPAAVRPILEQQISAIDEKLAAPAAAGSAKADSPLVRVNVTLASTVAAVPSNTPLFVFVRDPARTGPPLAAKRLESRFPQRVSLSASDSVISGRAFAVGQSVQVVARIARSGNPLGASGDPVGEVTYRVGRDGLASLVIDHVMP